MDRKIRILHVAQSAGGVDRYLRLLLKYLDSEKYESIVVLSQDFDVKSYANCTEAIEVIPMKRNIGIWDIITTAKVRKCIKKYKPDFVYAHSSKAGAVTRLADIGIKNHCIYNPHGWAFNMRVSPVCRNMYRLIEMMAAVLCEQIICISNTEKEAALEKKICKKDKLEVILNGIDLQTYNQSEYGKINKTDMGIPETAFVVGMVGRLSRQKAPDIFLESAKRIKAVIPSAHFIIVGSGEMEDEIRKMAIKMNLADCLHITGWVDNPISYIENFDVACLLSRWEGFGLVLPEYMVAGKPIVSTNVDTIPELIQHEENGLLVPVDNPEATSEAVIRLFQDAGLRKNIVEAGKTAVRKYDVQRVSREHEALFEKILKR